MSTTTSRTTTLDAPEGQATFRLVREFDATPAQLHRAHTDPEVYARWIGPDSISTTIDEWDCRTGGRWAYTAGREEDDFRMRFWGSFHEVRPDRLVQTFSFDGAGDGVSLDVLTIEDLGDGRSRLTIDSAFLSVEDRDAMLRSGMETGVEEGYRALDQLLAAGEV